MDESHVVQRLHGAAELERDPQRGRDLERRAAGQHLAEPASFDELRDGERPARFELAKLQYASHRGMRVRRGDDRASHAQYGLRSLRCAREVSGQEADRDAMAGRFVLADAYRAERAGADLVDDTVAAAHPKTARDALPALRRSNRRRTRLGFSATHSEGTPSAA